MYTVSSFIVVYVYICILLSVWYDSVWDCTIEDYCMTKLDFSMISDYCTIVAWLWFYDWVPYDCDLISVWLYIVWISPDLWSGYCRLFALLLLLLRLLLLPPKMMAMCLMIISYYIYIYLWYLFRFVLPSQCFLHFLRHSLHCEVPLCDYLHACLHPAGIPEVQARLLTGSCSPEPILRRAFLLADFGLVVSGLIIYQILIDFGRFLDDFSL